MITQQLKSMMYCVKIYQHGRISEPLPLGWGQHSKCYSKGKWLCMKINRKTWMSMGERVGTITHLLIQLQLKSRWKWTAAWHSPCTSQHQEEQWMDNERVNTHTVLASDQDVCLKFTSFGDGPFFTHYSWKRGECPPSSRLLPPREVYLRPSNGAACPLGNLMGFRLWD